MATDSVAGSLATRATTSRDATGLRRADVAFGGLLLALVLLPLYPKIGLIAVGGTYIPVRLDDLITVAAMALWGAQLWRERRWPHRPPGLTPAVAWLAAGLIAVVIGAGLLDTVPWTTSFLYWAKPIEYLLLGWLAYDVVRDPARRRLALITIFGTALVVVGYGYLQRFGWVPPSATYDPAGPAGGVVTSTMADRHQLSMYLGMLLLLGVLLWHRAGRGVRAAGLAGIVLTIYLVSQTATRSEYLALGGLGLLLLVPLRTRVPAATLVMALVLVYAMPLDGERILDSVFGNPDPNAVLQTDSGTGLGVSGRPTDLGGDASLATRFELKWPQMLKAAMADPIFGIGPSAATEAADGHYVRSFVEVGIVGTAAFVWLILAVALALRRVHRGTTGESRDIALAVLGMLAFIAVVGVLIDAWVASRPMQLLWPLIGIALAAGGWTAVSARDASGAALAEGDASAVPVSSIADPGSAGVSP